MSVFSLFFIRQMKEWNWYFGIFEIQLQLIASDKIVVSCLPRERQNAITLVCLKFGKRHSKMYYIHTGWDPKTFLQHEESLKTIKENALFRTLPGEPNRKFVGNWCNIPKTSVRKTCHISGCIQEYGQKHIFLYFWYPGRTSRYRLCSLYPILQGLPIRWVWSQKATWAWSCQNVSDVVLCRSSYNSMVPALCLVEKDGNFILKRMIENNWYLYRTPTGWVDTT